MPAVKRNDIFLFALSIGICALSYLLFNKNIELSLFPHKTVMGLLFNYSFTFIEDVGYGQSSGLFIIAQNCLGAKLFISLFLIMVFGFLPKYAKLKPKIIAIIKFYFTALILAFICTVIRIAASIPFCTWEKFHLIHNIISLGIYFGAGLILYFIMERRLKHHEKY